MSSMEFDNTFAFAYPPPIGGGKMYRGQLVAVEEAFAGQQVKRVVDWDENYIFVCREEEYLKAKEERREPSAIGFQRVFVREI